MAAGGESDSWVSPMDPGSMCPVLSAKVVDEEGVLKRMGVGGGRLGLMQPSEACWELWRGGGVVAVRLVRGVMGGLGFNVGMAF